MFSKEFDEIVNFRRSNRKFDPNIEVPNEVIQKVLSAQHYLPIAATCNYGNFIGFIQKKN